MCITDRPENLTSSLRWGTLVHRGLVGEVFDDRDAFVMLLSLISRALPQILDVWLNVAFQQYVWTKLKTFPLILFHFVLSGHVGKISNFSVFFLLLILHAPLFYSKLPQHFFDLFHPFHCYLTHTLFVFLAAKCFSSFMPWSLEQTFWLCVHIYSYCIYCYY